MAHLAHAEPRHVSAHAQPESQPDPTMTEAISPEFPYESRYVEVQGSRMHYVEAGEGAPIVLLHGNPTSGYLWRNVIPHLSGHGRCIAPDLIGFGKSDKPGLDYRIFDHQDYLDGFIEALGLRDIRFVLHDWGGFLGFHFAAREPQRVRAIAFMEAVVKPMEWADRGEQFQSIFRMLRSEKGWPACRDDNFFVERVLPGSVMRRLGEQEMAAYRAPFADKEARYPTWVFPNDVPLGGEPADVVEAVQRFGELLPGTGIPMLLLAFEPGAIVQGTEVEWCRRQFPALTVKEMGAGIHFVQEDQPRAIGEAIAGWLDSLG